MEGTTNTPLKWTSVIGYGCFEEERIADIPISHLYAYRETIEKKVAAGETLTEREAELHLFFQDEKVQKRMYWTRRRQDGARLSTKVSRGYRPIIRPKT